MRVKKSSPHRLAWGMAIDCVHSVHTSMLALLCADHKRTISKVYAPFPVHSIEIFIKILVCVIDAPLTTSNT